MNAGAEGAGQAEISWTDEDYRRIYKLCMFYLGNPQDAEDAVQAVFEKAIRDSDRFRGESAPSTWLYRIAVNTALNALRRRKLAQWFSLVKEEGSDPYLSDPARLMELDEGERILAKRLEKGIGAMSAREKTAFYFFYYDRLPQKEIAELMGISVSAVESLVHKAVKKIRKT